jgi:hypothetical protein
MYWKTMFDINLSQETKYYLVWFGMVWYPVPTL